MALPTVPGQVGYLAAYYASKSLDKKALGKFTDANHLSAIFNSDSPTEYDRGVVDIYTQTSLEANDFTDMINKSEPFFIDGDDFKWDIAKPYQYPRLIEKPASTTGNPNLGQDGIPFELVFDSNYFQVNDVITANFQNGDKLAVVSGPEKYGTGFLYEVVLTGAYVTPTTTVDQRLLTIGNTFDKVDSVIGEFDQDLSGINGLGGYITVYDTISAGYATEHTITKWADERTASRDEKGNLKDIVVYDQYRLNEQGKQVYLGSRWEPFVERMMKKEMIKIRKNRILYGAGGEFQTHGNRQENKKITEGIISRIRNHGQYMPINKGDFSINMLRDMFGSIFYRRVPMSQRRVKLYTNEAGIRLFKQANKEDLIQSGITIIADNRFIEGSGQNMMVNYGFDAAWTMETGRIEVSHLMELDLPQLNSEFGTDKYSNPVFLAFDISNATDGMRNIREIRKKGAPNMTWGYINGRQHHLGHAASQGMDSSSKFPGYTLWMEDFADVHIEDLSKCIMIEQVPTY